MKLTSEDISRLISALNDLIEMKIFLRKITPNYDLDSQDQQKFVSLLKSIMKNLNPLFLDYLEAEISLETEEQGDNKRHIVVNALKEPNMGLISSNSAKKILKNLGIDPRRIIVTGGPLFIEDYPKVNPNIPEKALKGIKKKCDRIIEELKSQDWNDKDLYFLYEKDDISDELTLQKINQVSDFIGKKVKLIEIDAWTDIEY